MENVPADHPDVDWEGLTHARRALIGNPALTPLEDLDIATRGFFENQDCLPRAVEGLCKMSYCGDARKLVSAATHAFARAGLPFVCVRLRTDWNALDARRRPPHEAGRP